MVEFGIAVLESNLLPSTSVEAVVVDDIDVLSSSPLHVRHACACKPRIV